MTLSPSRHDVILLGAVAIVLVAAGIASVALRDGNDIAVPNRPRAAPRPAACELLDEIDRPPRDWVGPSGALTISESEAGGVALAFGMRAHLDPSDPTAKLVASLVARRMDGQAIALTGPERAALAHLSEIRAGC